MKETELRNSVLPVQFLVLRICGMISVFVFLDRYLSPSDHTLITIMLLASLIMGTCLGLVIGLPVYFLTRNRVKRDLLKLNDLIAASSPFVEVTAEPNDFLRTMARLITFGMSKGRVFVDKSGNQYQATLDNASGGSFKARLYPNGSKYFAVPEKFFPSSH